MKAHWVDYLPHFLKSRIEGRTRLQKVLGNTGWMFFDKVFRVGLVFCLNVWVTRYLGPERFGLLSYASSLVSLFLAIANLGLYGIVVRDLVRVPEARHEILGSALLLRMVGGLVCLSVALVVVTLLRPGDLEAALMVAIIGLGMFFQAFEVFDFWFLSQLKSRYSLFANLPSLVLGSVAKVSLILTGAPLVAFAWATLLEVVCGSLGFLVMYQRTTGDLLRLRLSITWIKSLLRDSWPLVFAGLMVMVYTRIDQVMLGQMLGNQSVGVYAAAAKIAEFWYVIPGIILQSLYSTMVEARKKGEGEYYRILQKSFDIMALISYLFVLVLFAFSGTIMTTLYGAAYAEGGRILAVYVVSGVFVMLGHVREYWVTMENITRFSLYSTAVGAFVNVTLNYVLIPAFGPVGAAYATLVALFFSGYLVNLLVGKTYRIFTMQTQSLFVLPAMYRLLKKID